MHINLSIKKFKIPIKYELPEREWMDIEMIEIIKEIIEENSADLKIAMSQS